MNSMEQGNKWYLLKLTQVIKLLFLKKLKIQILLLIRSSMVPIGDPWGTPQMHSLVFSGSSTPHSTH